VPETLFRLEVWRPARLGRRLVRDAKTQSRGFVALQSDSIHEQAYGWRLQGDVWTSLGNSSEAKQIRVDLMAQFAADLPPEKRGFDALEALVERMGAFLGDGGNRAWQAWEPAGPLGEDADDLCQIQPVLALYHHLRWLCDVFHDLPGASVTVR
jgi:hypothetical protein